MGDTYDHYYKNATCSSSPSASVSPAAAAPAQPPSTSDEISLFLQQILLRSSSSLASVVAHTGKGPQFLFSSSPSVAALPDHLSRPCHSMFLGDGITAIDSSAALLPTGNPNVASSSFGASENETDEYDCESEEGLEALVEEAAGKPGCGRSSSKRSRAAEVHNMSEKRRRSRINEKMKALQNLIPNSNKTDKASMLDEAIEYLKQLQLQVQMLSMRNGMSLHPMCLPGALQPVQLSQMRMDLGEENRPLHLDMTGTPLMNQESPTQNLFHFSNQCTDANQSYVPDMSNVVNSETSFGLESSMQAHLGPFQLPNSSEGICREDMLQHQQINVNHSETNPLGGSLIRQFPIPITLTTCIRVLVLVEHVCLFLWKEFELGATARVSLSFNTQVSDPKGSSSLGACITGRNRQEGLLLKAMKQNFHIDSMRTGRRRVANDNIKTERRHI